MSKKIALITGVGPGTGSSIARRFSTGGYKVAMIARDKERLKSVSYTHLTLPTSDLV